MAAVLLMAAATCQSIQRPARTKFGFQMARATVVDKPRRLDHLDHVHVLYASSATHSKSARGRIAVRKVLRNAHRRVREVGMRRARVGGWLEHENGGATSECLAAPRGDANNAWRHLILAITSCCHR